MIKNIINTLKKKPEILWIIAFVLLIPALFYNLGLLHLFSDESTRILVAKEMMLSGNYVTPTILGEYYYNKPPLFNWVLILFFKLFGNTNELTMRIPIVLSLLAYSYSIYHFTYKHFSKKIAVLNALIFISCGRILFWDSMIGLIDILFSWAMYLNFMLIYHLYKKEKFWQLFIFSYLLIAIGYLFKGLPSIVFQGFTLLTFFIYMRRFKKLFSIQHLVGFSIFAGILSFFYYFYFQSNPDSIETVFSTLFNESSKRTASAFGIGATILHFFSFPFEMLYHFAPWTILILFCIRKDFFKQMNAHPFIKYSFWIFLANIIIYWTSVQVYPRYLLMHAPLVFTVFLYFYDKNKDKQKTLVKLVNISFIAITIIIAFVALLPMFLEETKNINYVYIKSIILSLSLLTISFLMYKIKNSVLILLVIALIIIRIGFNIFILPVRYNSFPQKKIHNELVEAIKPTLNHPLYVYKQCPISHFCIYHIEKMRNEILTRKMGYFKKGEMYIIHPRDTIEGTIKYIDHFYIDWENTELLVVEAKKDF